MEWHINDLSLDGQFADHKAFRMQLEPLLRLRHHDPVLRSRLYCSRLLHTRPVTVNADLRQAVTATKDRNYVNLVLEWISKSGPFWDDNRQDNVDDYFEYKSHDVTDQGLGEAARRNLAGSIAHVFSFQGSPLSFTKSPLSVQQGLPEAPVGLVDIHNHWDIHQLIEILQGARTYLCWQDVHIDISRRFENLVFSDKVMDELLPVPFSEQVRKRIFELLQVLNNLVTESNEGGELSPSGIFSLNNHFVGEKAWFTDESAGNKIKFRHEMTFSDPDDATTRIFCPWHGKIKSPQIRIHFQWPRPYGQKKIKVVYIGPKITKG